MTRITLSPEQVDKTLSGLTDLIRTLDKDVPGDIDVEERLAYKATQLGVLLAGVKATCQRASIGARAMVRSVAHQCAKEPEILVRLDPFRTMGPPQAPFDVDLNLKDVRRGASVADAAICALPDAPSVDGPLEERLAYSTAIGAILGVFEGLVEAGFEDVVFDAAEVTRKTTLTLSNPDLMALLGEPDEEDN